MLHVNLKERDCDAELSLLRVFLDVVEDVVNASRYDTTLSVHWLRSFLRVEVLQRSSRAEDRVSLAATSLAISHDHTIESIQHVLDHGLRNLLVGRVLSIRLLDVEDAIEIEVSHVVVGPRQSYRLVVLFTYAINDWTLYLIELDTLGPELLGAVEFFLEEGPHSNEH